MRNERHHMTRSASNRRVRPVVALALLLSFWLVLTASHAHVLDEHAPVSACDVCLALPHSAAAPESMPAPALVMIECGIRPVVTASCAGRIGSRFYPTRGPPVR